MFISYKRHRLLKILRTNFNSNSKNRLSFDFICEKINVDYEELQLIKSELIKEKEVVRCELFKHQWAKSITDRTKTNCFGLIILDNGINALSNKKYTKLFWNRIGKIIFTRLIPLVGVVILLLVNKKEIKELFQNTKQTKEVVSKKSTQIPNQNSLKDSLNNP